MPLTIEETASHAIEGTAQLADQKIDITLWKVKTHATSSCRARLIGTAQDGQHTRRAVTTQTLRKSLNPVAHCASVAATTRNMSTSDLLFVTLEKLVIDL